MPLTRTHVLFLLSLASCQSIAPPPRGTPRLLIEQQGARITATGFDFGPVRLGDLITTTLFVENTGPGPLQLERFERVGVSSGVQLGEEVLDVPVFFVPQTRALIPAGETVSLPISFRAQTLGKERAQLRLWFSSSTISEPVPFELTGQVVDATCDVQSLRDFGGVAVGEFLDLPLTLKNWNTTRSTVTLGPLVTGSSFEVRDAPATFTLDPMEARVVTIRFSPRAEGIFREVLPLKLSELCDSASVKLDGLGVAQTLTWGPVADFGFVSPGRTKELAVTVTNTALAAAELASIQLSGGPFFELLRPSSMPLSIPAARRDANGGLVGGTASFSVRFRPTVAGLQSSTLTALASVPRFLQLTLPVTGFGGGPWLQVRSLDLGRVPFVVGGVPPTGTLTVRNIGINTTPPEPAYNLKLATPPWTIRPANPQSLADELCLGSFVGGVCTLPPGVASSLEPQAQLQVPVHAALQNANTDANGRKEWDVTFHSNDPDHPMVTVRISVQPVQLPPCNFTLTPALAFGHISEPLPKVRALRLCNASVAQGDRCLVSNVSVQGNDFVLTELVRDLLLAPQECRTIGVRAEQRGPVPTTPTVRTGSVEVQLSSLQGRASVPLSATQAVGCLVIDPSPMDFGTVAMGCRSVDRTVLLHNQCNTPITITGGAMVDDGRQAFSVVTPLPQGPLTLTRSGLPVTLQLRFRPQREGDELGAFRISVQQPEALDHLVILRGRGAPTTRVSESIVVGRAASADVLLVVDSTGNFASRHAFLVNELVAAQSALMSQGTSMTLAATNSDVASVDCPRCLNGTLLAGAAGVRVVTPTTGTPALHMASWFQAQTFGLEELTANAVNAFTAPNVFDPARSGGLLRTGSVLGIIALTDSEGFGPAPTAAQLALLRNVKGANRPQDFSLSLISDPPGCPPANASSDPTVLALDGVHTSICTSTWSTALERAVLRAVGQHERFWLTGTPAPTPNFDIRWRGSALIPSDYSYDPVTNTVVAPQFLTQAATLSVSYDTVCLP